MEHAKHFTDLRVWQEAHVIVLVVYDITKAFPSDEKFGLYSQMRRASVSITSNIAEGFKRFSKHDKRHFYNISLASLSELQSQLVTIRDLKYITMDKYEEIQMQMIKVEKMLQTFIEKTAFMKSYKPHS